MKLSRQCDLAGAEKRLLSDVIRLHWLPLRCRNWRLGFKKFLFPPISRRTKFLARDEAKMDKARRDQAPIDHARRSRLNAVSLHRHYWLFRALNRKLPPVTVGIVETRGPCAAEAGPLPVESHRPDLPGSASTLLLQVFERIFPQRRHVRQMKRHVIDRFRRRLAFEQRDRDVVVANRNAVSNSNSFFSPKARSNHFALFFRIAHR